MRARTEATAEGVTTEGGKPSLGRALPKCPRRLRMARRMVPAISAASVAMMKLVSALNRSAISGAV
jgi:hypothetical protein